MSEYGPQMPTPRERFFSAYKKELHDLVATRRMTPEEALKAYEEMQAVDVSEFADPEYEAKALALHGRSSLEEQEMLRLWSERLKPKRES